MLRKFVVALMLCLVGAVPVTIDGASYRRIGPIGQQRVAPRAATTGWGVSVSAYGGGPAGGIGPALYVICNKSVTVYPDLTPPTYCLGSGAVPTPIRSLSESASVSFVDLPSPCLYQIGKCSVGSRVEAAPGVLRDTAETTVGPTSATDANYTYMGVIDDNVWNDTMSVSSTTLPRGTFVTIKTKLVVTIDRISVPCSDAGIGQPLFLSEVQGGNIQGGCAGGNFQFYGLGDAPPTCVKRNVTGVTCTLVVTSRQPVGYSAAIFGVEDIQLALVDCAIASCLAYGGLGAAIDQTTSTVTIAAATPGVKLKFASGHGY